MLVTLGENGVKTLDDLADLANDELAGPEDGVLKDYELSEEEANTIIMAARAHWFDDDEVEAEAAVEAPVEAPVEDGDAAPGDGAEGDGAEDDGAEDRDGEPVTDVVPGG